VHTPVSPAFTLIALAILVTLGYRIRVWFQPFKTCRRCDGMGRIRTRNGRGRPKPCKRCGGKGIRPRAFRKPQRAAQRVLTDARGETRHPAGRP
jgi:DnaJ-class molecular chaperone